MSGVAAIADVSRVYPTTVAPIAPQGATPAPQVDFADVLTQAVNRVDAMSRRAGQATEALAAGATDDIHGTMIAVREAEIGVHLVASVRNKLIDAFHELWRTGI